MQTKSVNIKTKNGIKAILTPFYSENKLKEVLCDIIKLKIEDKEYSFNYLDWHLFCYMVGNEEQRIKLANSQLRKVREIPYDIELKLSSAEKLSGIAKRRVFLPIDEAILHAKKNDKFKQIVGQEVTNLVSKKK